MTFDFPEPEFMLSGVETQRLQELGLTQVQVTAEDLQMSD
ncbi:hypothetical protein COO91_04220 [Nostoc flagelliforme CCNUN1]|uniref:Uncharacterized protein n=1 Tax=Nostoc flagelliforme CCNUN1 TaxID=2038116 RepID=A0A2K8STY4_9NOSO|nr:hypothetical protein COO91_04220 [Nostoc flagelliforme CCNUN1]